MDVDYSYMNICGISYKSMGVLDVWLLLYIRFQVYLKKKKKSHTGRIQFNSKKTPIWMNCHHKFISAKNTIIISSDDMHA